MNGNLLKDHFMLGPLSTDYFLSFYVGNLMWYIQKLGEGNGNPLQCSCLEIPGMGGGAWWAAVYGVAQSRTRLKQLGSSIQKLADPPVFP